MGWRDLLQAPDETVVSPWVGGRTLQTFGRVWTIDGRLPREFGWYTFKVEGRKVKVREPAGDPSDVLRGKVRGYLVGDRFVPEDTRVVPDIKQLIEEFEPVFLIEPGLDRFVRVSVGRSFEGGPLIFEGLEMPLGPEEKVLEAFLDNARSVDHVPGVVPALDAAFRVETWQRKEEIRRRLEEEQRQREEDEKRQKEERRNEIIQRLGDAAGRRDMAKVDFQEAARAALAVGNAELIDQRQGPNPNEMLVRFRIGPRRFECICHRLTLRIIDAGVCLIDHADGNRKDDGLLTLESLPGVLREAERIGRLVVFRHI